MLLIGGLKEILTLRQLACILLFAIFIGAIRHIALLIEGIGTIVRRAVEFRLHKQNYKPRRQAFYSCLQVFESQQIYHSFMNYNELTFHKANPFYKQDFMPDRAWFNRKSKDFPSEMPSGKDYFVESGRKHFNQRFNHSEIESNDILKSPERYPFENRIAFDKTYMRNLHTIDIQGASSNTRVNQSIKNKYKAQDQLARRYNQSVDLAKAKEKTEEEKRREVALRQFQEYQERKMQRQTSNNPNNATLEDSNVSAKSNNPEKMERPSLKKQLSQQYQRFVMQNSSNKFSKDIPLPRYPQRNDSYYQPKEQSMDYSTLDPNLRRYNSLHNDRGQRQEMERQDNSHYEDRKKAQETVNPAPTPPTHYQYQFNGEKLKNSEQYQKILKYQEMSRQILQNPRDLRKNNPTNLSLSFNLAGQSIVSS